MTRGKKLGALLLVLILLTAAVWAVTGTSEETAAPAAEQRPLLETSLQEVSAISWQYEDSSLSFEKADGKWIYPLDEAFPVSEGAIYHLLSVLGSLTAEKTINSVTDLGEYGLEEPLCTVVLDDEICVRFGNPNALGDARYVTLDGVTVHLTDKSTVSNFNVDLFDMLRTETIPYIHAVTAITVEREGEDLVLRKSSEKGAQVWYGKSDRGNVVLDKDLAEKFADTVTGIYWGDCVSYNADSKALQAYGLQKPRGILTVEYSESEQVQTEFTDKNGQPISGTLLNEYSFVLELGKDGEEGVYARLPGSSMVYEISHVFADAILYGPLEDLLPRE